MKKIFLLLLCFIFNGTTAMETCKSSKENKSFEDLQIGLRALKGPVALHFDNSLKFSHNLVINSSENIWIWDSVTGKHIKTLTGHTKYGVRIATHPTEIDIASIGSNDKTIRLWNIEKGEAICVFKLINGGRNLDINPEGKLIVYSGEHAVEVIDVLSGKTAMQFDKVHSLLIDSVKWNCNGEKIASGSLDRTIGIWDMRSSKCLKKLFSGFAVNSVAWNPADENQLVSAAENGAVGLWDISKNYNSIDERIAQYCGDESAEIAEWHPQGSAIVSGSVFGNFVLSLLGEKKCNKVVECKENPCSNRFAAAAWSSDGETIAASKYSNQWITLYDMKKFNDLNGLVSNQQRLGLRKLTEDNNNN